MAARRLRFADGLQELLALLIALLLAAFVSGASAADLPEYRLKAAFLYNFAQFTEWPADTGATLNLCVLGPDPFGAELEPLQGKPVADRHIAIHRVTRVEELDSCQVVFISAAAIEGLPRVLANLHGAVLTVADSPGAAARGVALNMNLANNKISFEANLEAARKAHLNLSSKLLHLATEVRQ